jgi:cytochrome c556
MNRTLLTAALLTLTAVAVSAEPTPESIVAYRKVNMDAYGKHMKAIGMVVKGEVERPAWAAADADALAAMAKHLGQLFPAGTGPDNKSIKTEAKADIWSKPADFAAAVKSFQVETAKLAELSHGTDFEAFKAQLPKVGKSCGGCHDGFKVED